MLVFLYEYEKNGYHDSDFFARCWNTETSRFEEKLVGTTRFGGCGEHDAQICYKCAGITKLAESDLKALEPAMQAERNRLSASAESAYAKNPECVPGERVVLTKDVRQRPRAEEKCAKCDGSGKWVNPRNSSDKRTCFACNGKGKSSRAVKGKMITVAKKGDTGIVLARYVNRSQYGTWVQSIRAKIRLDNGTEITTSVESCELVGKRLGQLNWEMFSL